MICSRKGARAQWDTERRVFFFLCAFASLRETKNSEGLP